MAEKILMLALSPTMEEGTIHKWLVNEGDEISIGDILCDVETDKATMEYESTNKGVLLKIIVQEGSSVLVGEPIAIIGKQGENIEDLLIDTKKTTEHQLKKSDGIKEEEIKKEMNSNITQLTSNKRIKVSPVARKLSEINNINLQSIQGSGPDGRIIKRDIENILKKGIKAELKKEIDIEIPFTQKRKIIAERMVESKFTAPHYYLNLSIDFENIIKARKEYFINNQTKISINSIIMKIVAVALKNMPEINVSIKNKSIIKHSNVDIGLAVAQEDGLITPIVRSCDQKGIKEIDNELKDLINRARNNTLSKNEYTNATFTISNLGNYGIESFTAIINPPASAILAIGSIQRKPIVDENDIIIVKNIAEFTLSCDHRVIDGAVGAEFLKTIKDYIENPIHLLF